MEYDYRLTPDAMTPIDLNIAKLCFSEIEYNNLRQQPYHKQIDYFYLLWTLKESYLKYKGIGLSIPLNSYSFVLSDNKIYLESDKTNMLTFKVISFDKKYRLAISSEEKIFQNTIHYLSANNILQIKRQLG